MDISFKNIQAIKDQLPDLDPLVYAKLEKAGWVVDIPQRVLISQMYLVRWVREGEIKTLRSANSIKDYIEKGNATAMLVDPWKWAVALAEYPLLASTHKVPWREFKPEHWAHLLTYQPQLAIHFHMYCDRRSFTFDEWTPRLLHLLYPSAE